MKKIKASILCVFMLLFSVSMPTNAAIIHTFDPAYAICTFDFSGTAYKTSYTYTVAQTFTPQQSRVDLNFHFKDSHSYTTKVYIQKYTGSSWTTVETYNFAAYTSNYNGGLSLTPGTTYRLQFVFTPTTSAYVVRPGADGAVYAVPRN